MTNYLNGFPYIEVFPYHNPPTTPKDELENLCVYKLKMPDSSIYDQIFYLNREIELLIYRITVLEAKYHTEEAIVRLDEYMEKLNSKMNS